MEGGRDDTLSFKWSCALTECKLSEREREMEKRGRKDETGHLRGDKDSAMAVCSRQRQTDERKMEGGE